MKNPDTRIQMTKRLLKNAMLAILKEKPISSITVKELCDTAGINRGTFYLHYDTPLSLLKEIENEFVQNNMAMFESFMKDDYDRSISPTFSRASGKTVSCFVSSQGQMGTPDFKS